MIRLLERILHLQQGDLIRGYPLVLYNFLVITCLTMSKVARDVLFLDNFAAVMLPYADLSITVCVILVMAVYLRIGSHPRINLYSLVIGSLWLFAVVMGVFWWLVHYHQSLWLFPAFYIWIGIFGALATSQVWILASEIYTTREAKRVFGILGSGAIGGAITGGFSSRGVVELFGTESLLLFAAVFLIICSGLVWHLTRHPQNSTKRDDRSEAQNSDETPKNLTQNVRFIWDSTYLLAVAGVICLTAVVTSIIGWQFKAIAKEFIPEKDDLAAFMGTFLGMTGLLGLAIQLLLTSRLLRRLGLGLTLLFLPIALITGSLGVLIAGTLGSIVMLKGADSIFRYSIDKSTVEMLYLPVPSDTKFHIKPFIDTVVQRFGDGLGGLAVLVFATFIHLTSYQLSWITLILLGVWCFAVIIARRHYVATLAENIRKQTLDSEDSMMPVMDRNALEVLAARLKAGDPKEILYALEVFALENHSVIHPAVRDLLAHPAAEVRCKALSILNIADDLTVMPQVETLLQDEDIAVRTEALLFLSHHARIDPLERLEELGDFPNFSVQSAMIAYLAWPGQMQNIVAAQTILDAMLMQLDTQDNETRLEAARLIAVLPDHFDDQLEELIKDSNTEVARQAIRNVGSMKKVTFLPHLLERMHDQALTSDVVAALSAFGDEIVDTLNSNLSNQDVAIEVRREIPRALLLIDTPSAQEALVESLLVADTSLRHQVIAAINGIYEKHPGFAIDSEMIDTVLMAEIVGQYRSFQMLGVLTETLKPEDSMLLALHESMNQRLERIFRLMALEYPGYNMMSAHAGFLSKDRALYDNALEFLDNVLKPGLRGLVIALLDREVTDVQRVKHADEMLGVSMDRPEEALATLMDNEDPWLKSCAVYTIGILGLHALESEVDLCLDHENPLLRETARQAKLRLAP
ncbi:MAG: MFS transporter [Candidatus Latescibacteria bacterium]|jgi:ATP:ADP antiporter, AAA family|nr:MFS transporter [Candidatus Latescibacterota bacterium]